eukprot:311611-Lingulodinium_polyedra.AAC.1
MAWRTTAALTLPRPPTSKGGRSIDAVSSSTFAAIVCCTEERSLPVLPSGGQTRRRPVAKCDKTSNG